MSTLNIGWMKGSPMRQGQWIPVRGMSSSQEDVSFTATAGRSSGAPTGAQEVRISADTTCRIKIAAAGHTAVTASTGERLPADVIEYRAVPAGYEITVIQE